MWYKMFIGRQRSTKVPQSLNSTHLWYGLFGEAAAKLGGVPSFAVALQSAVSVLRRLKSQGNDLFKLNAGFTCYSVHCNVEQTLNTRARKGYFNQSAPNRILPNLFRLNKSVYYANYFRWKKKLDLRNPRCCAPIQKRTYNY